MALGLKLGKSGGGGASLPSTIVAGDTVIYATSQLFLFENATYVDTGCGFTALRAGTYRISFGLAYGTTYSVMKLRKNGVDVSGSEMQVSYNPGVSLKTIDVPLSAGDLVALWGKSTSTAKSTGGALRVSILATDLQDAIDEVITPR